MSDPRKSLRDSFNNLNIDKLKEIGDGKSKKSSIFFGDTFRHQPPQTPETQQPQRDSSTGDVSGIRGSETVSGRKDSEKKKPESPEFVVPTRLETRRKLILVLVVPLVLFFLFSPKIISSLSRSWDDQVQQNGVNISSRIAYLSKLLYYLSRLFMFSFCLFGFLYRQKKTSNSPSFLAFTISTAFSTFWRRESLGIRNNFVMIACILYAISRAILGVIIQVLGRCSSLGCWNESETIICVAKKIVLGSSVFCGWLAAGYFYKTIKYLRWKHFRSEVDTMEGISKKNQRSLWMLIAVVVVFSMLESYFFVSTPAFKSNILTFLTGRWRETLNALYSCHTGFLSVVYFIVLYCSVKLLQFRFKTVRVYVLPLMRGMLAYLFLVNIHRTLFVLLSLTIFEELEEFSKELVNRISYFEDNFKKMPNFQEKLKEIENTINDYNKKLTWILHYVFIDRALYFGFGILSSMYGAGQELDYWQMIFRNVLYSGFLLIIGWWVVNFNDKWTSFKCRFRRKCDFDAISEDSKTSVESDVQSDMLYQKTCFVYQYCQWKTCCEILETDNSGIKVFGRVIDKRFVLSLFGSMIFWKKIISAALGK